eukprot:CAMPEP_0113301770 /NCGR_PEP_ID=MMETSP0010_2-20120614/2857_1 /TAXON_ID=216773 ORGANISM="Corethron hystrix, Strain 308" /NCGR_SAMPLE_ID=MMETSP0010_2 /ASSEMBLY_ACC=CAM_ASM_000155 /LENGTH=127 /DNA_ID=CAMNT_0000155441 /DNA_START=45 /DNA_END=425 /DNA_ORIENTATION=+ /assembly_acc=CAM_ASM_000155
MSSVRKMPAAVCAFAFQILILIVMPGRGNSGVLTNDKSCATHADCMVKNVGNCCGDYPMCVNHEFQPDLGAVRDYCANNTKVGVCGWSHIDACACVEGSCTYLQCNQDMNEDDGCSLEDFSKDEVAW